MVHFDVHSHGIDYDGDRIHCRNNFHKRNAHSTLGLQRRARKHNGNNLPEVHILLGSAGRVVLFRFVSAIFEIGDLVYRASMVFIRSGSRVRHIHNRLRFFNAFGNGFAKTRQRNRQKIRAQFTADSQLHSARYKNVEIFQLAQRTLSHEQNQQFRRFYEAHADEHKQRIIFSETFFGSFASFLQTKKILFSFACKKLKQHIPTHE